MDKFSIAKIRKGNNSINTEDRVMVLAFCVSGPSWPSCSFPSCPLLFIPLIDLYHCIQFHLFIFNTLRDMLWTSIRKANNSVITCDRVTVLALCTSSDGRLSMYQVSFNSLLYFQRYAPDKLFIAKIKIGSNSVNTVGRTD